MDWLDFDTSEVAPPRPTLKPVHAEWAGTDLAFTTPEEG